jgi:hypothetical protein
MMRRKHWIIAVAILLGLLAGDVAYWRVASERLRTGYEDWLAEMTAEGWDAHSGEISINGWPTNARIDVRGLTLSHAGPAIPGDLRVTSSAIALSVSLLSPDDLQVSLSGPVHVRVADSPDLIVTSESDLVSIPLRTGGGLAFDLRGRGLRIEPASGNSHTTVGLLNVTAHTVDQSTASQRAAAISFTASAEAIALPSIVKWPLGSNISSMTLVGTLNGPLPAARNVTRWAEAWRDGGGSLAISHLTMGWGPLGLTSSATLALDDQLQPMGSGNARVVGYAATLDRLAAGGILTRSAAIAAKAVLSLMAGAGDPDQPSAVDVPLTLQYRTLSMRQVPLVRLPELDWPTH